MDRDNQIHSIGGILQDSSLSTPEKLEIDRVIRQQAMEFYKKLGHDHKLFININPSWMDHFPSSDEPLPTIEFMQELNIPPGRIVIEITEHDISVDFEKLQEYINRYRAAGCLIAVDDFSFEHFERLLFIMPDLVKLDITLLRQSIKYREYNKLVNYVARFSVEMGIEVIFEGIETEEELQYALSNGGAYLQGFLFSRPQEDFQPESMQDFNEIVTHNLQESLRKDIQERNELLETEQELNLFIRRLVDTRNFSEAGSPDKSLLFLEKFLPERCIRAYICDSQGIQLSSNFDRQNNGSFELCAEFIGKNWAWRPYFSGNVARMDYTKNGCLSEGYIDFESKQEIYTYSFPIGEKQYLFLDLEGLQ